MHQIVCDVCTHAAENFITLEIYEGEPTKTVRLRGTTNVIHLCAACAGVGNRFYASVVGVLKDALKATLGKPK
ncbi:MAG: hypothetical protein IT450_04970 [Phycisphaerales bacterium]|nr:hypothetical protein [Phycisphaerales bacterium]